MIKDRPPRLGQIFQTYDPPLFFVTICTLHRRPITQMKVAHEAFRKYALKGAQEFEVAVGRYALMPDHFHFFVRGDHDFVLAKWVNGLKRAMSAALGATKESPRWQPGFFDHLLRNDESYSEKWEYVRNNPVRHRLVKNADDWPYQGEVVLIDRA